MALAFVGGSIFLCCFCGWASTLDECKNICIHFLCCKAVEGLDIDEEDDEEATTGDGIELSDLEALRRFRKLGIRVIEEQRMHGRSGQDLAGISELFGVRNHGRRVKKESLTPSLSSISENPGGSSDMSE